MDRIIVNSRGDIGVVRSMVMGFEVEGATVLSTSEPALLTLNMVGGVKIHFEVASTDEEMKPHVERLIFLLNQGKEVSS